MRFVLTFFAVILAVFVASNAVANDLTGGTWEVRGSDVGGTSWDATTLVFTSQIAAESGGYDVEGYFDWVADGNIRGRELFRGVYAADQTIVLTGYELVNSIGIISATYTGLVTEGGDKIIAGWTVGVPGDFVATRGGTEAPLS